MPFCATYPTVDPALSGRVRQSFHPYQASEFVAIVATNTVEVLRLP